MKRLIFIFIVISSLSACYEFNNPYELYENYVPGEASLVVYEYVSNDLDGNDNGVLDAGESVVMDVSLYNAGISAAASVQAVLSTTDSYISITNNSFNYGHISAKNYQSINYADDNRDSYSTSSSLDPSTESAFSYKIDSSCPIGHVATFTLTMTDTWSNVEWTDTFEVKIGVPVEITAYADDDDGGNNDGFPTPGEGMGMDVKLYNTSSIDVEGLQAELSTLDSYITITNGSFTYGGIGSEEYQSIDEKDSGYSSSSSDNYVTLDPLTASAFTYQISADCPVGYIATFTLTMTDSSGNSWTDIIKVTISASKAAMTIYGYADDDVAGVIDNGMPTPGEDMRMDVRLNNAGISDVSSLQAVLTTIDSYITITNESFSYGLIEAGEYQSIDRKDGDASSYSSANLDPLTASAFTYQISAGCPAGHIASFTLTMTNSGIGGGVWTDTISVEIGVPVVFSAYADDDVGGNDNDKPNPGENIRMDVRLHNLGSAILGIRAVLSTTDSSVTIPVDNDDFYYGDISAGYYHTIDYKDGGDLNGSSYVSVSLDPLTTNAFTYTISPGCPVGHVIPFKLTMTDSLSNEWTDSFNVTIE